MVKYGKHHGWLVVWNIFSIQLGRINNPNWLSYFSEGWLNHQPDGFRLRFSQQNQWNWPWGMRSWPSWPSSQPGPLCRQRKKMRPELGRVPAGANGCWRKKTATNRDWLVVWNIFCFPFHIWDNPSHWLIFFRGLKPPTTGKFDEICR